MRTFTNIDYMKVKPIGRMIVVEVEKTEKKTTGGILLPDDVRDNSKFTEVVGRVVSMGELAFYKNVNGTLQREDVVVGDQIMFHPYAGDLHESKDENDGPDYRMLHDDAVVGRLFREGE